MIDFPITELLDDASCLAWLEQYVHPTGFVCPHCGRPDRRLFVREQAFPLYRCRARDRYYTLLTNITYPFVKTVKAGVLKFMASFLSDSRGRSDPRPFFAWYRHPWVTPASQDTVAFVKQEFGMLCHRASGDPLRPAHNNLYQRARPGHTSTAVPLGW